MSEQIKPKEPLDIDTNKACVISPQKDNSTLIREFIRRIVFSLKKVRDDEDAYCKKVSLADVRCKWEIPLRFDADKRLLPQLESYIRDALERSRYLNENVFRPDRIVITHRM